MIFDGFCPQGKRRDENGTDNGKEHKHISHMAQSRKPASMDAV